MPTPKPAVAHPNLKPNKVGLTLRDYEGAPSTLCAGCGHDSVTAAIVRSFYELDTPPHMIAKLSGIGCSSKTPTYFVGGAHGFNSAHGRMPSIATGANAANRELTYIGISGDGDSLSIGIGQLAHAVRRNLDMVYVVENNGVYGLTKGQFSASADVGSKSKRGEANRFSPIDPCALALDLGRDVRGAQLLGRQGAAGADPEGGAVAPRVRADRRDLAVRDLQRSRGVDQELPAHAQAPAEGRAGRLRAAGAGDHRDVRGGDDDHRDAARRQHGAPAQAVARNTTRRTARARPSCWSTIASAARSRPACCSSRSAPPTCTTSAARPTCRSRKVPYEKLCPGKAELDKLQHAFR